jgi:sulfate adenylyltransferase
MPALVPPHGGKLLPLLVSGEQREQALVEASRLPQVMVNSRELSDLIMLATGAFSPLNGFMGREDYNRVVREMRLKSGQLWPIPVTLAVSQSKAATIREGQKLALVNPDQDEIVASLLVEDKYSYDKRQEAVEVFGTDDPNHPGIRVIYEQDDIYLGGQVSVFSQAGYPERFPEFARPAETRAIFTQKGWGTIAAFQTRNPMHRSHEYLTKIALEVCDGLLIHPIVGKLKTGDIPAEVRLECYRRLIDNYYPKDRVVLKVYPMEMRYAGPREAILHAIIRQNFGCSHLIVGRDHAGVGSYYRPFDAQRIFDTLKPGDLYIQPLKLESTFWCHRCGSMASAKTCPHPDEDHLVISGTLLREMLARGERPPEQFSRKEIVDVLIEYYQEKGGGG